MKFNEAVLDAPPSNCSLNHTGFQELDKMDDEYFDELLDEAEACHFCGGDGWGIVGVDWDCTDAINGPYDGDIEQCPCCNGSGLEKDATFW